MRKKNFIFLLEILTLVFIDGICICSDLSCSSYYPDVFKLLNNMKVKIGYINSSGKVDNQ